MGMPVSWQSRFCRFSATAMFSTMVPSTARPVASVSAAISRSKPRLMSGGSSFTERMYRVLATSSTSFGSSCIGRLLKDQHQPRGDQQHGEHLAKAPFVEPPVDGPAEPGAERQRRQRQGEQYQPFAVERHHTERRDGGDVGGD